MKKNKACLSARQGFAPVLIIVIVIALALIGGGIYYFSTKNSAPVNPVVQNGGVDDNSVVQAKCLPNITPPWIKVTTPNGGENYNLGGTMSVTWNSCNLGSGTVGIELVPAPATIPYPKTYHLGFTSNDGSDDIALSTGSTGPQVENIPAGQYKILISTPPETQNGAEDLSDEFFNIGSGSNTNTTTNWKTYNYKKISFEYPANWRVDINRDRLYGQDPNDNNVLGLTINPPVASYEQWAAQNPQTVVPIVAQEYGDHSVPVYYNIIVDNVYLGSIPPEEIYQREEIVNGVTFSLANGSKFVPELQTVFSKIVKSVKKI